MLPGMPKANVVSRVIMAPEHAKRLMLALQENIMKYEQQYGQIQISGQKPRTIAPFGNGNQGQASVSVSSYQMGHSFAIGFILATE